MNYKERFVNSIDEYKKEHKKLRMENESFSKDGGHSEDEIKENTKKLEALNNKELKKLKSELEAIIEDKRKDLGTTKGTDVGRDYQLRLTNLLIVFKRSGSEMTKENIVNGLVLFTEDPLALENLREALIESGRDEKEVAELIPENEGDSKIARIDELKVSLDKNLKITLKNELDGHLGFEPLLNPLDGNFNYIG